MLRIDNKKIVFCALRGFLWIILLIYSFFIKNVNVYRFYLFGFFLMNAGNFCFAYLPVPVIFYPLVMLLNVFGLRLVPISSHWDNTNTSGTCRKRSKLCGLRLYDCAFRWCLTWINKRRKLQKNGERGGMPGAYWIAQLSPGKSPKKKYIYFFSPQSF